tara:strand:+ start:202 stop:396 length:195 start_codon:yes stop_codon:yes gene_type:complete
MHTLGFHIFGHQRNADGPGPIWALDLSHLPIADLLWTLSNDSWSGSEEEKEDKTATTHDHPILG